MSYWKLEKANLSDRVALFPIAHPLARIEWIDIIGFSRFTLWLLLLFNAALVVFLAVAGYFLAWGAVSLVTASPAFGLGWGLFAVVAITGSFRILRDSVRLGLYLTRSI